MLHLRIVSPPDLTTRVLEYLTGLDTVVNVVHLPRASQKPDGDMVLCDVAREQGSVVLATLTELGCDKRGSISVDAIDVSLSLAAREAEKRAAGSAADAVVWEEVAAHTSESAELSVSFVLFMILAALITAVAIMTDSVVLLIGGMVVGPEFGPLAGLCVALVQRRPELALRSAVALVIGFGAAVFAAGALAIMCVRTGLVPSSFASAHPQTMFISRPDAFSVIIAAVAGVAGMYSLTTAKPGALIGVFISVTTLPAASNIGVAAAVGQWTEMRGAALQLSVNLIAVLLAGLLTLGLQRLAFVRRVKSALQHAKVATPAPPRRPRPR